MATDTFGEFADLTAHFVEIAEHHPDVARKYFACRARHGAFRTTVQ
jgi:hypothetical protein